MSSSVLYRKYRPQSFKDVLGQEHIISVLESALKGSNLSHAYLFSGSRGTGKTSVARILAREAGCSDKDLYEIDAASNRGIDDIRELRQAVNTLPFESPYKVYIIDEVHMLTKEAFNALLKTLEEPPAHALFILATTEYDKLPDTIVSRCQNFVFKKPSQQILKNMVLDVAKREKLSLELPAADLMALLGDGSFRDTLGILQKIITSSGTTKITTALVEKLSGTPRGVLVNEIIAAIDGGGCDKGLMTLHTAEKDNVSMNIFCTLVLHKLRAILLLRYAPNMEEGIHEQFGDEDFAFLKEISQKKESRISASVLREFLEAQNDIQSSHIPALPLELALIEVCKKV